MNQPASLFACCALFHQPYFITGWSNLRRIGMPHYQYERAARMRATDTRERLGTGNSLIGGGLWPH